MDFQEASKSPKPSSPRVHWSVHMRHPQSLRNAVTLAHLHAVLKLISLLVEYQGKLLSDFCCLSVCQLLGALPQQRRGLPEQLQLLIQLLHELLHLQASAAALTLCMPGELVAE